MSRLFLEPSVDANRMGIERIIRYVQGRIQYCPEYMKNCMVKGYEPTNASIDKNDPTILKQSFVTLDFEIKHCFY